KKEPRQSTMFVPATVTNVEVINSALVKLLLGRPRPIGFQPREMGDELQAELHTDLLDHEIDRSEFPLVFYDTSKECLIFGNSFMKFFWEKTEDKRRLLSPVLSGMKEYVTEQIPPGTKKGFKEDSHTILVKDGVTVKK